MTQRRDRQGGSRKKGGEGSGARRMQQVARVLRDRDDHVARGLALLGELGVLDERTRNRLWSLYQQGDQATREFLQEQVARVIPEAPAEPAGTDAHKRSHGAGSVDPLELEVLKQLSSPHVDAAQVAQHVRRFDPARLLGAGKEPGGFMRFLSDAPLAVHRVQKRLLWTGVSILVFVVALLATAVFVPAIVPWVGLGGVVLLALFIGVLLVRTAGWIGRSAKHQGIDLAVYAQLPEDERRVLLVRRIGLRILDPHSKDSSASSVRDEPSEAPPGGEPVPEQVPSRPGDSIPQEAPVPVPEEAVDLEEQDPAHQDALDPENEPEHEPEHELEHEAPVTVVGRNGPEEGPGRISRFLGSARKAWRQAAQSETAHRVGSKTQQVSQEAGRRARQAGRTTKKRFSELRERGEAELTKRRETDAKKTPSKKRTVKKSAAKKDPAKRTVKRSAKNAPKKAPKSAGKTGGNRARKATKAAKSSKRAAKRQPAGKGAAKKGTKRPKGKQGQSGRKRA